MEDSVLNLIQKNGLAFTTSGRDYLIRCLNPEHPDTNPSLRIDKVSGSFHCFACGFKGNLFKYYNVFTSQTPIKIARLKEKLNELKTFNTELDMPPGSIPYTRKFRDISVATLREFGAFYTNLEERLQDRIVFPIKDITGKTVVFVARHVMSNGNPRYINYPRGISMPLFPSAAPTGAKSIILVEGLFDFLNVWDKGLKNVVCCFGTNTLQKDLKQKLFPFKAQGIQKIYLMFDGDTAGQRAQEQLKPEIEQEGFQTELIVLPEGLDPGDLSQEYVNSILEYTVDKTS